MFGSAWAGKPFVPLNYRLTAEELRRLATEVAPSITICDATALPKFFETRFSQQEGSVDGILCWDIFDYVDRPAAQALARHLVRILRPDGALLAATVSAGCAGMAADNDRFVEIIARADVGLVMAKRAGRNRVIAV